MFLASVRVLNAPTCVSGFITLLLKLGLPNLSMLPNSYPGICKDTSPVIGLVYKNSSLKAPVSGSLKNPGS